MNQTLHKDAQPINYSALAMVLLGSNAAWEGLEEVAV